MSYLTFSKSAEPSTPATDKLIAYEDTTTRKPMTKDDRGIINVLSGDSQFNWLRNAGFEFRQRQTAAATTYTTIMGRQFTLDGWAQWAENNGQSVTQVDSSGAVESGLISRYYATHLKTTALGKHGFTQAIEGSDACQLRGRNVRLQLKMKATVGADYNIALVQLTSAGTLDTIPLGASLFTTAAGANGVDPTLGTNLAYIAPTSGKTGDNVTSQTNAYRATLTTSWQQFGGVFTVPTNCKNLVVFIWSNNQVAVAAGFSAAEISLTLDEAVQAWSPPNSADEWLRMQRFYQKSFLPGTVPVTNAGAGTGERRGVAGKAGAVANSGFILVDYVVPMRATPTVTVFNPAAANALARNITGAADMGATTITSGTARNFYTNSTGVAATAVGDLIAIHFSADADL
jgi:hypothetical protein